MATQVQHLSNSLSQLTTQLPTPGGVQALAQPTVWSHNLTNIPETLLSIETSFCSASFTSLSKGACLNIPRSSCFCLLTVNALKWARAECQKSGWSIVTYGNSFVPSCRQLQQDILKLLNKKMETTIAILLLNL